MTILIVEDEVLIGMALRMVLRVAGYRVHGPVARGDQALALAAKEPPDLALVDIGLAGPMPGTKVARLLYELHDTVCVFLTSDAIAARASKNVAFGLITKPYDPRSVLRAVEAINDLGSGRPPRPLPTAIELFHPWDKLSDLCRRRAKALEDGWRAKVRLRAHSLWQQAGCPNGRAEEFWFRAEKALLRESEQHVPEALPDDPSQMDDLIGIGRH